MAGGFSSSGSEWYNPIDEVRDKSGRNWIDDKLQLSEDEWDDLIDKDPKFIKLKANPFPQFDKMLYIMQERGQLVPTLVPTTATMTTSPILHSVLPLRSIMKLLECANLSQRKRRYERRKDEDESNDGADEDEDEDEDEDDKEPAQKRKANRRGGRRRGACQVTRTGQALSCQG
ncbi:hypothetical protein J007_06450 [Cryptococcus neoformans]|nr:hypothetical protein J007_06450 [Cryptococcus neoformans var. grubii]OXC58038.1 hypothetical protein C358_06545 [Cryptococcus neoformans var. grubii MW-RSA852]